MEKMKFEKEKLNEENKSLMSFKLKLKNLLNIIKVINKIKIIDIMKKYKILLLIKNINQYIILGIPFILMDYFIREETKSINFYVLQKYIYLIN